MDFLKMFAALVFGGIGLAMVVCIVFYFPYGLRKNMVKKNPNQKALWWFVQILLTFALCGVVLYVDTRFKIASILDHLKVITPYKVIGLIIFAAFIIGIPLEHKK